MRRPPRWPRDILKEMHLSSLLLDTALEEQLRKQRFESSFCEVSCKHSRRAL